MYSGSDSTESANCGQWPLNPTFFQNMPNEQVDWAALAQQWIQMKEAGPPIPEPRVINDSNKEENGKKEVAKIDEEVDSFQNDTLKKNDSIENSWNWKEQHSWEWGSTWGSQLNTPPIVTPSPKPTLLQRPKGFSSIDSANINSEYTSRNSDFGSSFSGHQSNHSRNYKPHNRRYSKVNVPKTVAPPPTVNIPSTSELENSNLDASKRKQLPAWIREGLEKMERDKQRQIEREKEKQKQSFYSEKIKEHEKETMEILRDTIKERRRSKFDSDDEPSPKSKVIKEEIEPLKHDELMLLVRRTMTEILLKVTNDAIQSICSEERQRYLKKNQTYTTKGSGRANVSAKLGLGMYGSDSGSETDDSEASRKDSDFELRNSIKKKQAEFIQTERGIEDKLLQAEQNRGNLKVIDEEDEGSNSENHQEESTTEPKNEENINSKHKSYARDSSHSSDESDKESSRRRSSSQSRDSSSSTRRKNRSRSKDRGYTPDRRKKQKSPRRSRSRSYDRRYSSDHKYKRERGRSDRSKRSRSRSRTYRRSRSRSSSYRSRRSSETSSRPRRKRSRSPYHSRSSRRSRSRSHNKSSRTR